VEKNPLADSASHVEEDLIVQTHQAAISAAAAAVPFVVFAGKLVNVQDVGCTSQTLP
jgi:hypothetical protein